MLRVQRIASFVALDGLRLDWNDLSDDIPFRRFEWLGTWAESYLRDDELYVLEIRDDDKLVGLLPLYRSHNSTQRRVLRWLGSGEVCTDYLGIMVDKSANRDEVIAAISDWLVEAAQLPEHGWDALELESIDADEPTISILELQLKERGCTFRRDLGLSCWRIELPETLDEYLATMSKSHRRQVKRVDRRLQDGSDTRIHQATDLSSFMEGMQVLVSLHQKRRNSLGDPGCFSSARFSDFLHKTAFEFLSSGLLRLSWAEVNRQPIACEFQLAGASTTYAYQSGVDPEHLEHEPGRMIMLATIRDAISKGQSAFDFLRGDEPYKAHWRAVVRPTFNLQLIAPTTRSYVHHSIWLAGSTLKNLAKSTVAICHPRLH